MQDHRNWFMITEQHAIRTITSPGGSGVVANLWGNLDSWQLHVFPKDAPELRITFGHDYPNPDNLQHRAMAAQEANRILLEHGYTL